MLAELALHALARTEPSLRRLGLVGDSVRLWSRRARCRKAWAAHEARCHAVVQQAVQGLPQHRKVLVLGSGLARDIPIARLAATFEAVVLADAVHLPITRLRLRHLKNVTFVTSDVSGVGRWLVGEAPAREDNLARFINDTAIDLVISANLLSQLPIGPQAWAEAHPARAPMPAADLAAAIIRWHLGDLARFRARVCLLTDTSMQLIDKSGALIEAVDLIPGANLPPPDDAWDWLVAPQGDGERGAEQIHAARGYWDLTAAWASQPST